MRLLIFLLTLIQLTSCAQKNNTSTSFKLTMGALGAPAEFSGGLVVYGKSLLNNDGFVKVLESSLTADHAIPNGRWSFFAIGWDGTDFMTGKAHCASATNIELNGTAVDIELAASNINCKNDFWGQTQDVSGEARFPKIQIETCNKLDASITNCSYNPDTNIANYKNDKGYLSSYRFEIKSFFKEGANISLLNGNLVSSCVNVNPTASGLEVNQKFDALNLPAGVPTLNTPFSIELTGFYNTNCTDSNGVKKFVLKNGTKTEVQDLKSSLVTSSGNLFVKLYTLTTLNEVCSDMRLSPNNYAAGSGTDGHPFVICTPKQFSRISNVDFSKSFVLGQNLNFSGEEAILKSVNDLPCTQLGDNFVPIGGFETDAVGNFNCTNDQIAGRGFTGKFDGLNHTMKGFRFENGMKSDMGLFRNIVNGVVQNLQIEKAYIQGNSKIGVITGLCDACHIKNITIKNSNISGYSSNPTSLGFIAAEVINTSTISNTYIYDSFIRSEGNNIGAIAGLVNGSTISQSISENINIEARSYIGGIAGRAINSIISEVGSTGVIISRGDPTINSHYAAGVAGSLENTSLDHSYSNVMIHADENNFMTLDENNFMTLDENNFMTLYVGGIAGKVDTNSYIQAAYSAGKIKFNCANATFANCKVGSIAGDDDVDSGGAASITNVFVDANDLITGYGGISVAAGVSSLNNMQSSTSTLKNSLNGANNIWIHNDGFLPRFRHESSFACNELSNLDTVANQKTNSGRGSETNPIIICNVSQFLNMTENAFYSLMSPLKFGEVMTPLASFNGTLNANNKAMFAIDLKGSSRGEDTALIKSTSNSSLIKNIKIYDATISLADNQRKNSILVADNAGKIQNARVFANIDLIDDLSVSQNANIQNFGMIASRNQGILENVKAYGSISTDSLNGAIASLNTGTISDCSANVKFQLGSSLDNEVGGIVAVNNGSISKCSSESSFFNDAAYGLPTNGIQIGGIAGYNDGDISDSSYGVEFPYNHQEFKININGGNISAGGITGVNDGTISKTYVSSRLRISTDFVNGSLLGAITGSGNGTVYNTYALNSFEKYLGSAFAVQNASIDCTTNNVLNFNNIQFQNDFPIQSSELVLTSANAKVKLYGYVNNSYIEEVIDIDETNQTSSISNIDTTQFTIMLTSCPQVFTTQNIQSIELIETVVENNNIGEVKTFDDLTNFLTYCPELETIGNLSQAEIMNYKCSDGFDIVTFGGGSDNILPIGMNRMINTFKKEELDLATGTFERPVWEFNAGMKMFPRLFKINDD